jgi:hypothetical protein
MRDPQVTGKHLVKLDRGSPTQSDPVGQREGVQ